MYKRIYVSPTTEKNRVEVEGNVCASFVEKADPASNAPVTIDVQKGYEDQTVYEYDAFDATTVDE